MCELFCSYLSLALNAVEQAYNYLIVFFEKDLRAETIIAIVALWFPLKEWLSKKGHKIEVIYSVCYSCYQQPKISDLWIYNNKNKIEVITEINVLFGANCAFQLKEFNEAFILNPYEMKEVDLDSVSIYAINCKPVNMRAIFENKKIKRTFFFTTPDGRIKGKNLKQIPHDTFIKDTLYKGAFGYIYHRQYPVENKVLDFKIKYFGYCVFSEQKKYPFYIYQEGLIRTDGLKQDHIKIDLEKYNTIDKVKRFLSGKRLDDKKYTIEIYQRSPIIDKTYTTLEERDITPAIYSNWKYFFIEPIARFYMKQKLKQANRKRKKAPNETKV